MAHGAHPNFMDKHEEHHRPELQKGLVIKHNANQRYATSGVTAFLFKEVGRVNHLPTQVTTSLCPNNIKYIYFCEFVAFSNFFSFYLVLNEALLCTLRTQHNMFNHQTVSN